MSADRNRPPSGESWTWQTRDLLASDAWRSLGINGRRLLDFLQLEHMGKAGQKNGLLKAPYRQLEGFGIGQRFVRETINDLEMRGLLACQRNGLRAASTYTLTWLPSHDGAPASDFWRGYRDPTLQPLSSPKSINLLHKGKAGVLHKGTADGPHLPHKSKADRPQTLLHKGTALLRDFLPGQSGCLGRGECESGPSSAAVPRASAAPGKFRVVPGGAGHE
jgi:hypothetical protein